MKISWSPLLRGMMPVLLGISLTACQSDEAAVPPPSAIPAPEKAEPAPEATVQAPAYTTPLTGLPVKQPDLARPVAVMINNAPAARPQSGLAEADMVYEVLAEGGITRLVAVYQSYHGDAAIGPVRSIRPYLITLGETVNGLLVHAGGSNDAYAILQNGGKEHLDEITNASAPFWRDSSRKAPHNLYTNEQKLRKAAADKGYTEQLTLPVYPFLPPADQTNSADNEPAESLSASTDTDAGLTTERASSPMQTKSDSASNMETPAGMSESPAVNSASSATTSSEQVNSLQLKYLLDSYTVGYAYDSASGEYTRSMNGKPHIDLNTREPLTAANVIVLGADYKVLDDVGRLSLDLESGGEALMFQQGRMIRGEWSRSDGDVIRFRSGGQETPLVPGVTYYNIVPNSPTFYSHLTIDDKKMDNNG
ncbi:DUF3048 domain-containing protein [Paenibacillus sp. Z6-24]